MPLNVSSKPIESISGQICQKSSHAKSTGPDPALSYIGVKPGWLPKFKQACSGVTAGLSGSRKQLHSQLGTLAEPQFTPSDPAQFPPASGILDIYPATPFGRRRSGSNLQNSIFAEDRNREWGCSAGAMFWERN